MVIIFYGQQFIGKGDDAEKGAMSGFILHLVTLPFYLSITGAAMLFWWPWRKNHETFEFYGCLGRWLYDIRNRDAILDFESARKEHWRCNLFNDSLVSFFL